MRKGGPTFGALAPQGWSTRRKQFVCARKRTDRPVLCAKVGCFRQAVKVVSPALAVRPAEVATRALEAPPPQVRNSGRPKPLRPSSGSLGAPTGTLAAPSRAQAISERRAIGSGTMAGMRTNSRLSRESLKSVHMGRFPHRSKSFYRSGAPAMAVGAFAESRWASPRRSRQGEPSSAGASFLPWAAAPWENHPGSRDRETHQGRLSCPLSGQPRRLCLVAQLQSI